MNLLESCSHVNVISFKLLAIPVDSAYEHALLHALFSLETLHYDVQRAAGASILLKANFIFSTSQMTLWTIAMGHSPNVRSANSPIIIIISQSRHEALQTHKVNVHVTHDKDTGEHIPDQHNCLSYLKGSRKITSRQIFCHMTTTA